VFHGSLNTVTIFLRGSRRRRSQSPVCGAWCASALSFGGTRKVIWGKEETLPKKT